MRDGVTGLISAMVFATTMATVACADYSGGAGTAGAGGSGTGGAKSSGGAATGGSSGCPNGTACGGDLTGTWTVSSSCVTVTGSVDLTPLGISCTVGTIKGSFQVTGTWTATSDGTTSTYADNTHTSGTAQLELPAECHNVSGTTTTCVDLARGISNLGYTGTCSDNSTTGGCTCPLTAAQDGWMGTVSPNASTGADYTIASNVITVTDGRNHTAPYQYCVATNTLTVTPQSTKYGTAAGTIVLQK